MAWVIENLEKHERVWLIMRRHTVNGAVEIMTGCDCPEKTRKDLQTRINDELDAIEKREAQTHVPN